MTIARSDENFSDKVSIMKRSVGVSSIFTTPLWRKELPLQALAFLRVVMATRAHLELALANEVGISILIFRGDFTSYDGNVID